jgi:cyclopropane fatty-acyl-phospholipid synthase-like methyltransferase
MKVLDIGAGLSALPAHLVDHYDVEVSVADDFGKGSGDKVASLHVAGRDLPKEYPQVQYIFERVGNDAQLNALPKAYFDRIYPISVLEQVPSAAMHKVFKHMISLLNPGGLMLHTIDLPFPLGMGEIGLEKIRASQSLNEIIVQVWLDEP